MENLPWCRISSINSNTYIFVYIHCIGIVVSTVSFKQFGKKVMSFPQIWSQRIFMNPWIWKSTTSDPGFRWWDLDKQNKFNTNIRKNTFSPFGHHILQEVFFWCRKIHHEKKTFSPYSRKMLEEFVGWGKMIDSMIFVSTWGAIRCW